MTKKTTVLLGVAALGALAWVLWHRATPNSKRKPLNPTPLFDVQLQVPGPRDRIGEDVGAKVVEKGRRERHPVRSVALEARATEARTEPPERVFQSGKRKYAWRPDHWAVPIRQYRPDMGEEVSRNAHLVFFKSEQPPEGAMGVVSNPSGGGLKVVTGRIRVAYSAGALDELMREFALVPVKVFDDLNSGYFTVEEQSFPRILEMADRLSRDPRVTRAEVEVMQSLPVPQ